MLVINFCFLIIPQGNHPPQVFYPKSSRTTPISSLSVTSCNSTYQKITWRSKRSTNCRPSRFYSSRLGLENVLLLKGDLASLIKCFTNNSRINVGFGNSEDACVNMSRQGNNCPSFLCYFFLIWSLFKQQSLNYIEEPLKMLRNFSIENRDS